MEGLSEVNALGNKLTELPACIAVMPNLTMLDVTGNNIRDIPRLYGSYPSLKHLFIDGAKLTKECLTWLRDKAYYC
jgi:Leucine-rich repeat (LRR) protein